MSNISVNNTELHDIDSETELFDVDDKSRDFKVEDEKLFVKYCQNHKYYPVILPAANRVIAIGDLHGDYNLTIKSLKLADVIDDEQNWIGKDTIVVQIGDQLDSKRNKKTEPKSEYSGTIPEDIKILEFMTELNDKAIKHGGLVISLLGNHEIMNVLGDMRYVAEKDKYDTREEDFKRKNKNGKIGKYAKLLACTRVPAVIIGSFIFVHAGLIKEFLNLYPVNIKERNDIYKISYIMRRWLLGIIDKDNVGNIIASHKKSLFWDRILGSIPPNTSNSHPHCMDYVEFALNIFKVGNMIIGHTPQFAMNESGINSTCYSEDNYKNKKGKLWRIDIGASYGFNEFDNKYIKENRVSDTRIPQVLEILKDKKINILKEEINSKVNDNITN